MINFLIAFFLILAVVFYSAIACIPFFIWIEKILIAFSGDFNDEEKDIKKGIKYSIYLTLSTCALLALPFAFAPERFW